MSLRETSTGAAPPRKVFGAKDVDARQRRAIFTQVDKNGDGLINIRELIVAVRGDPKLAETLGLPSVVREGDSRNELELFFQNLDTDADRRLTFDEFSRFFSGDAAKEEAQPKVGPEPYTLSPIP
jgi:hypothetical protein